MRRVTECESFADGVVFEAVEGELSQCGGEVKGPLPECGNDASFSSDVASEEDGEAAIAGVNGESVDVEADGGRDVLVQAAAEFDVESWLLKLLPSGRGVPMHDVVLQLERDAVDIELVHAFMGSRRFREMIRVHGETLFRVL